MPIEFNDNDHCQARRVFQYDLDLSPLLVPLHRHQFHKAVLLVFSIFPTLSHIPVDSAHVLPFVDRKHTNDLLLMTRMVLVLVLNWPLPADRLRAHSTINHPHYLKTRGQLLH